MGHRPHLFFIIMLAIAHAFLYLKIGSFYMGWINQTIQKKIEYTGAGVYRIRLFKNKHPFPINRFKGTDNKGILTIGRTSNIERRRRQFHNIVYKNSRRGHSEAVTWWLAKKYSESYLDETSLKFDYVPLSKDEAKEAEKKELQAYFKKYLELPPLNAQIPKRVEWYEKERTR